MSFGSSGGAGGGMGSTGNAIAGSDLCEINTEQIAFQTAPGRDKFHLLPSPWPTDNYPSTTASLLSVAPTKGLLAAAGPDTLVVATTDSVRQHFNSAGGDGSTFTPQGTISIPHVSQVAFSSDESCLVIAAEQGGGLAVYDTNSLMNGGKDAAFQLATEGQSVRQLLPNPNPSADLSRYFGIVTENGQLLLADLKEQRLVSSSSGSTVFHEKVSCACWSRLGKQIVAGLADGTAAQIDPQGVVKATIPEPPQLAEWKQQSSAVAHPITSIFWLDTHDFLIIHTPFHSPSAESDGMRNDDSLYHLAHRDKAAGTFSFSKFTDPCPPFGVEKRRPAHHFVLRLREWLSLSDLLMLSSTASTDLGIFTRSRTALDPEHAITDAWTYTQPPDARRAAMPLGAEGADTSPIGMAFDLSVKEKVRRPIPTDETLEESPVPLPALLVLDNEGSLSMWYVIYNESVRQSAAYGDLVAAGGPRPLSAETKSAPLAATNGASAFGGARPANNTTASPFGGQLPAPAFGAPSTGSTFGQSSTPQPQKPAFGASAQTPTFGQPSSQQSQASTFGTPSQPTSTFGQPSSFGQPSAPAFGGASSLGGKQSPWASGASTVTPGNAAPAFGKPSFGASTFGQASGMTANKASPWGTPSSQQQSTSTASGVFGGNASQASPFSNLGSAANQKPSPSPFASSSSAAAAKSVPAFASSNQSSSLSSSSGSAFGTFGQPSQPQSQPSPFGAKPTLSNQPSGSTVSFGSGMSFGSATGSGSTSFGVRSLASPTPTPTIPQQAQGQVKEESMEDDGEANSSASKQGATGLFGLGAGGFKLGSGFQGDGSAKDDLPKPAAGAGAGLFGKGFGDALGSADSSPAPKEKDATSTPIVKKEPGTEDERRLSNIPPAPSSTIATAQRQEPVDDAPLPPDPTTWKPKPGALPAPVPPGFENAFDATAAAPVAQDKTKSEPPARNKDSNAGRDANATIQKVEDTAATSAIEPLAGSPPIDLGSERFSEGVGSPEGAGDEAAGPVDSGEDEEDWSDEGDEEGEDDEDEEGEDDGEGEEEEEEGDEEDITPQRIDDPKGLSAFESRLTPASPKRATPKFSKGRQSSEKEQSKSAPSRSPTQATISTTPATEPKKKEESYTPAGLPKPPVLFSPPQQRGQQSPRSPSPQRSATSPARGMGAGFAGMQSQFGGTPAMPSTTPAKAMPSQPQSLFTQAQKPSQPTNGQLPQRIAVPAAQLVSKQKQRSPAPAAPVESTEGTLEDAEDARIQALLSVPIEPTTNVPAFLAHQDYVASADTTERAGLGGQIERVYRDVNSMIDTLGLNARSLRGFVEGNAGGSAARGEEERTRLDLEDEESWNLGEGMVLQSITDGVEIQLQDGKLEDVRGAIEGLREEEMEVTRVRARVAEARKAIAASSDAESAKKSASLPLESQALQLELRQGVLKLQELLGKAEEGLSLLRAELASLPSAESASAATSRSNVPTVEAVTNTILKMTALIEKKSGDIDVLESQIRRLGGPEAIGLGRNARLRLGNGYEDELSAALGASRISSSSPANLRMSAYASPPSTARRGFRASVSTRSTPVNGGARRSLLDVPDEEIEAFVSKREARKKIVCILRDAIEARGARVVKVGS